MCVQSSQTHSGCVGEKDLKHGAWDKGARELAATVAQIGSNRVVMTPEPEQGQKLLRFKTDELEQGFSSGISEWFREKGDKTTRTLG